MTITGDNLMIFLVLLALGLTIVAFRIQMMLFRLGAALAWLTLGIMFWTGQFSTSMEEPWVQVISLIFLVMTIGVLTLQMKTDIRHEAQVRGKIGYPGAEKESWTTWGPNNRKGKLPSASERQAAHRMEVRRRLGRK